MHKTPHPTPPSPLLLFSPDPLILTRCPKVSKFGTTKSRKYSSSRSESCHGEVWPSTSMISETTWTSLMVLHPKCGLLTVKKNECGFFLCIPHLCAKAADRLRGIFYWCLFTLYMYIMMGFKLMAKIFSKQCMHKFYVQSVFEYIRV